MARILLFAVLVLAVTGASTSAIGEPFVLTQITDDSWDAMPGLADRQLALDPLGRPHAVFANGSTSGYQTIDYAWRPDAWVLLPLAEDPYSDRWPAMAPAPDGAMHVLYVSWLEEGSRLDHVRIVNGVPDPADSVCARDFSLDYPSVAVSPDGIVHAIFRRGEYICYARRQAGTWSAVEEVTAGEFASLAVGADGHCHFVYQQSDAQWTARIYYVHGSLGAWSPGEHLAGGDLLDARNPTIAVDAQGHAHVAYEQEGIDDYYIDYRVREAGGWSPAEHAARGWQPSVALDAVGEPHLAYWAPWTTLGIAVSHRLAPAQWVEVPVDPEARFGFEMPLRPAIAVDATGGVHVLYNSRDPRGGEDVEMWYAQGTVTSGVPGTDLPRDGILTCGPNPTRGPLVVRWALTAPGWVRVSVHDVRGRLVRTLHEGVLPAGEHAADWNGFDARGRRAPAGVYACRVSTQSREAVRKVVLVGE